ncbi:unnamed protein product [Cyprideis torosa]|uniref:Uncharacterized protein n=1 Tax=Cyprideis torosa TaxID=163714 RepID=A0A7R8W179_9CRUS|nr:unnamed protein product [Cyprideis torosa]CAG0880615.1 unnamed protein product [Cyprideis torosa]
MEYIKTPKSLLSLLRRKPVCTVDSISELNSDHCAISTTLELLPAFKPTSTRKSMPESSDEHLEPAGSKRSLTEQQWTQYEVDVVTKLYAIDIPRSAISCSVNTCSDHSAELDAYLSDITNALSDLMAAVVADASAAQRRKRRAAAPRCLAGWSELIGPCHANMISLHRNWLDSGGDHAHPLYATYSAARQLYHKKVRWLDVQKYRILDVQKKNHYSTESGGIGLDQFLPIWAFHLGVPSMNALLRTWRIFSELPMEGPAEGPVGSPDGPSKSCLKASEEDSTVVEDCHVSPDTKYVGKGDGDGVYA